MTIIVILMVILFPLIRLPSSRVMLGLLWFMLSLVRTLPAMTMLLRSFLGLMTLSGFIERRCLNVSQYVGRKFSFFIGDRYADILDKIAAAKGLSRSAVVRMIVESYINSMEEK